MFDATIKFSCAGVVLYHPQDWAVINESDSRFRIEKSTEGPSVIVSYSSVSATDINFDPLADIPEQSVIEGTPTINTVNIPQMAEVAGTYVVNIEFLATIDSELLHHDVYFVNVKGEQIYSFELEALEADWDSAIDKLESILDSVEFIA